jgi:hypothetical protein
VTGYDPLPGDDEMRGRAPFAKPGFIVAAVLVGFVAIAAIVVIVLTRGNDVDNAAPTPPAAIDVADVDALNVQPTPILSVAPRTRPETDSVLDLAGEPSICGLVGNAETTLTQAPVTTWLYDGVNGYPHSELYGPAATAEESYWYCFAHSPGGAVLMAGVTAVQSVSAGDPWIPAWLDYVVADGPFHEDLVEAHTANANDGAGMRFEIQGFRLLEYTGATARVDIAVKASADGVYALLSAVYDLVWHEGDWKIKADHSAPIWIATIPDLVGYVPWTEASS